MLSIFIYIRYLYHISVFFIVRCFLKNEDDLGQYLCLKLQILGPSFIKLGQVLAVRPDIVGDKVASSLLVLQDRMPAFDGVLAKKIFENETGLVLESVFSEFSANPVAAASIAQVHKAVTKDGENLAIKILRPNIEQKFARDIKFFKFIAGVLNMHSRLKRLRLPEVVKLFADIVKRELDLRIEAASISEMTLNSVENSGIYLPKIYWRYTARRVLVMEWIEGVKISDKDAIQKLQLDPKIISKNLAIWFLNQAFGHGFFHADMHPGNMFVTKEGNIVPVDFGIMGRLDKNTRIFVAEILRGFMDGDYLHVAKIHLKAGYISKDFNVEDFALACRAIGEPIMGLPVNQISVAKLLGLLFKVTEDFNMQTQPQLLLLQKTMVMVEGVGTLLYADVNMWQMADAWVKEWAKNNLGLKSEVLRLFEDLQEVFKILKEKIMATN